MTVSLKHKFQSAKADSGDASIVRPSNWNDEHELTLAGSRLIGRYSGSAGAAQEIALGTSLAMTGGTMDTVRRAESVKTADYAATAADNLSYITMNKATAGQVTLPALAGASNEVYIIRNIAKDDVTIKANAAELIEGLNTFPLSKGETVFVWPAAGNGSWRVAKSNNVPSVPASVIVQQGYLFGLTLSNNAVDATNDIDIVAGVAAADTSPYNLMQLANGITKRLDAAWAVGSGNGGWLDGASMPNGTGHAFLIQRSDTGVVDLGFSASLSPVLPTNYDRKRRVGSIIREGGAIVQFVQDGDTFLRVNPGLDINSTNPGTSASLSAVRVPLGIIVEAILNAILQVNASSASFSALYVSSPFQSNDVPSLTASPLATVVTSQQASNNYNSAQVRVLVDTSRQIRWRVSNSDASTFVRIAILGWVDKRGRT